MKRLCATVAILALSGGLAFAQGGGGGVRRRKRGRQRRRRGGSSSSGSARGIDRRDRLERGVQLQPSGAGLLGRLPDRR